MKVKDMQGENFALVQNQSEVEAFNLEYNEDFSYYYIEFVDDCADKLFGADSCLLRDNVYLVADL